MDQDYVNKLDDKDKEWLSNFNEEYYGNKLSNKTKRSKSKRKAIYDQTNARNRDIYNIGIRWENGGTGQGAGTTGDEESVIEELEIRRDIKSGKLIIPDSE